MSLATRARRALARYPSLYWIAVATLAATAAVLVARAAGRVETARAAWGEPRTVIVAIADIEPGAPLAGAVEARRLPSPMVPTGAVESVGDGATSRQRLAAGEVLVAHDVLATSGPQQLIPDGWLAVAIAEPVTSGAGVGDAVQVASGGIVLASEGVVVGVAESALLVAIPADAAPEVAQAASMGDIALLLER